MLSTFVLVGGPFAIRDTDYDSDQHTFDCVLGHRFEMHEEFAHHAIADGAALLPADQFERLGFTADELKKYPSARAQQEAPAEFHAKLLAARIAVHEFRAQLALPKEA